MSRFAVIFLLPIVAVAAACSGGGESATVAVELSNWKIEPSVASAPAGTVELRAVHRADDDHGHGEGGDIHDLAVAKRSGNGSFQVLGQVNGLKRGEKKTLKLKLEAGEYELQCNALEQTAAGIVAHYQKGMKISFAVTP